MREGRKARILVVEDDPAIRRGIVLNLLPGGCPARGVPGTPGTGTPGTCRYRCPGIPGPPAVAGQEPATEARSLEATEDGGGPGKARRSDRNPSFTSASRRRVITRLN